MEKLKDIIIFLIIILLIITIIIIILLLKNKKEEDLQIKENFGSYENGADQVNIQNEIVEVNDATIYYTVYECINNYIKAINMQIEETNEDDYIEGGQISFSDLNGIYNQQDKNKLIYNLLESTYINNININEVEQYIPKINLQGSLKINKMFEIDGEKVKQYIIYINVDNNENSMYLVALDLDNQTYAIRPLKYVEYTTLKKEDLYVNIDKIEKNSNNRYEYSRINEEEMAKKYFYDYKNSIFDDLQYAYNRLNEEYRNKRFGSFDEYKEYISNNFQEMSKINIRKFSVNNKEEYTEYICKDQYDNIYEFKAYSVMNYELKLDTYTLKEEIFDTTYLEAEDEKKVQMNIDKFVQMINRHDYKTSYNCISQGFKNNYLKSQEEFETFVKNIFFNYNSLQFKTCAKKGSNLYVCYIELRDLTGESQEVREVGIIMQLKDGTEFEMSFSL